MEKEDAWRTDTIQNHISEGTPDDIRLRYARLADRAKQGNFGGLDEDVIVLDTETTGFSLHHDELTQIAAARVSGGTIIDWYVTFVNPMKPIPEDVAHLTDIHDADVADAPLPEEALGGLVEFVGQSDIVAHNAEFDRNFTTKHVAGYPLLENTWIDSLDLARIALPRLKSHRLIDLVKAFDAPISTHRADADVEALSSVYLILLAAVASMPAGLVKEIAEMATAKEWQTSKVFKTLAAVVQQQDTQERATETEGVEKAPNQDSTNVTANETIPVALQQESQTPFSVRSLRLNRVKALEIQVKTDADVIAADSKRKLAFPSEQTVKDAFSKTGLVGSLYEGYELRNEQLQMAEEVRTAFETSTNLAVEAGTGVGKSMAYLVPAVLTAKLNNIAVGVATKTNALLDQLVFKELPLLNKALKNKMAHSVYSKTCNESEKIGQDKGSDVHAPQGIVFAALKGFAHYPCLRKIDQVVKEGPQIKTIAGKEESQVAALAALLSFIEQSEYDDLDALKIDYRVLPRWQITTSSNDCLRRKCPFYGTMCFVHGARRRAESADVVVTNHSLLFCDTAADGGLLPPIRYWVLDEAHGAETEARRAFSLELSAEEILQLARRVSSGDGSRNAFVRVERRLGEDIPSATLMYSLTAKAKEAGKLFDLSAKEFCLHLKDLLFFDTNKQSKGYEFVELWINNDIRNSATFDAVRSFGKDFIGKAEVLVKCSQDIVAYLEDFDSAADVQRDIASITIRLKEMLNAADTILFAAPDLYAYAATLSKKPDRSVDRLSALLLNVGDRLNETLYANTHSVVFTSATMTVADSFESFERAVGLNHSEFSQATVKELTSSYDFDHQMTIYVASDMPEPYDAAYLARLQDLLVKTHRAQQGSMLTLFTNRREMEKCFDAVQPQLKQDGLRLVCQKWGVSTKGLRDDFLADQHLSLFALKSFWEGFDAPGATLRGVIIPKLPFSKPSDPLSCERAERDSHAWSTYVLPQAVFETKQAAGRLIRNSTDCGCLILADRRLLTKSYGKVFLRSLPSKTVKVLSIAEIVAELTAVSLQSDNKAENNEGQGARTASEEQTR